MNHSTFPAAKPRLGYARYVVVVLMLANVSAYVDRQLLGVLVAPIKRDFGITDAEMSYLSAAFSLCFAVLALPIAHLAGRVGRRTVIATGIATWSVFTVLCATARTYARLFLWRIGVGVGEASLNAPSVSLIGDYFPPERLGRAMSIYSLGTFFGSGVGYFLGGWIAGLTSMREAWDVPLLGAMHPWQSAFVVAGVPGLFIALLVLLTVREPPRPAGATDDAASYAEVLQYVGQHRRTFLTHGFGFSGLALVNFALAFWIPTFFQRTYGWDAAAASRAQGLLTMTIGVGGVLLGGWTTDWFVRRGFGDGAMRVGIIGGAGLLVSTLAMTAAPTPQLAIAALAIVNVFAASPWGAAGAAIAAVAPSRMRAQVAALFYMLLSILAGMGGPVVVAQLNDHVFGPANVRYSIAAVAAGALSLAIALLYAGLGSYRASLASRSP